MSTPNPAIEVWLDRGMKQGIEQGIEQGIQEGYRAVAQRMHQRGVDNDLIADAVGWPSRSVQQMFAQ